MTSHHKCGSTTSSHSIAYSVPRAWCRTHWSCRDQFARYAPLTKGVVQKSFVEQADETLCVTTEWPDLASELDVATYQARDGHPDGHEGTPFRPMFLAYLWTIVEAPSLSGIPDHLSGHPELVEAPGFDSDDPPSASMFRPVRLNDRFNDLTHILEQAVEEIQQVAAERGVPIGYDLRTTQTNPVKTPTHRGGRFSGCSDGTAAGPQRDSVRRYTFVRSPRTRQPNIHERGTPDTGNDGALTNTAAITAGAMFGDSKNPPPRLDDACNTDGPSGETLLDAITAMSVGEITDESTSRWTDGVHAREI